MVLCLKWVLYNICEFVDQPFAQEYLAVVREYWEEIDIRVYGVFLTRDWAREWGILGLTGGCGGPILDHLAKVYILENLYQEFLVDFREDVPPYGPGPMSLGRVGGGKQPPLLLGSWQKRRKTLGKFR